MKEVRKPPRIPPILIRTKLPPGILLRKGSFVRLEKTTDGAADAKTITGMSITNTINMRIATVN